MAARVATLLSLCLATDAVDHHHHHGSSVDPCGLACKGVVRTMTCLQGCKGIDKGICKTGKFGLCKAGCLGIRSCKRKCEHAIIRPCEKKLCDDCYNKCEATIIRPCERKCDAAGFGVCVGAISAGVKVVGNETSTAACAELCTAAAAAADGAGGGPEDPFADAVAAAIEVGCNPACKTVINQYAVKPVDHSFPPLMCNKMGFHKGALLLESNETVIV